MASRSSPVLSQPGWPSRLRAEKSAVRRNSLWTPPVIVTTNPKFLLIDATTSSPSPHFLSRPRSVSAEGVRQKNTKKKKKNGVEMSRRSTPVSERALFTSIGL